MEKHAEDARRKALEVKAATIDNANNSVQEAGIARFDVIQQSDDPTQFVLVEVYRNAEAPALHKETAHYLRWRDTVADMMAERAPWYEACADLVVATDGRAVAGVADEIEEWEKSR